jgi:hypothetical protein
MLVQINSEPDQYMVVPTDVPIAPRAIAEYLGTDDFTISTQTTDTDVNRRTYTSDQRGNATIVTQSKTTAPRTTHIVTLN